MSYIIYSVASLLGLALFLAISLAPAFLGYWIGRHSRWPVLRWILPAVAIGCPVAWAGASYKQFERDCSSLPKTAFYAFPQSEQAGVVVTEPHDVFGRSHVLSLGVVQYTDTVGPGKRRERDYPKLPPDNNTAHPSVIEYAVKSLPMKPVAYWWRPPIQLQEFQIVHRASGKVTASATDLVFGGGIFSLYMRLFGGDQDYDFLSCGYASPEIGPWRPTLSSRPGRTHYQQADSAFLRTALTPQETRKPVPVPVAEEG